MAAIQKNRSNQKHKARLNTLKKNRVTIEFRKLKVLRSKSFNTCFGSLPWVPYFGYLPWLFTLALYLGFLPWVPMPSRCHLKNCPEKRIFLLDGGLGENRTLTSVRIHDFESCASTNSATRPAKRPDVIRIHV